MSESAQPRQDAIADGPPARRCAECGAIDDEATRDAARRRGRVVFLTMTTVLVAAVVVALIAHRGRERFQIGSGVPVGRPVSPTITWADVQSAAEGKPAAQGLFAGVLGIGEGWSVHVPAELRLWSEFTPGPAAMDLDHLRGGKGAVEPLRWPEVLAMRRSPGPDRALAQRLLEIHGDRAIDPAAMLKITPDPGVLMSGEMTIWTVWLELATTTRIRYVRDGWFGASEPVAAEPRVRMRPGWPKSTIEMASADPRSGVLTIDLDLRGIAAVVAGAGLLGLLGWFAFGGLRARRARRRAARGECLACGYPLAEVGSTGC